MHESAKRVFDNLIAKAVRQTKPKTVVRYRMPLWGKLLIATLVGLLLVVVLIVTDPLFIEAFERALARPW